MLTLASGKDMPLKLGAIPLALLGEHAREPQGRTCQAWVLQTSGPHEQAARVVKSDGGAAQVLTAIAAQHNVRTGRPVPAAAAAHAQPV